MPVLSRHCTLPAGVSLNSLNPVMAELVGVPTESGSFPVTITGQDSGGETASLAFMLTINSVDQLAPPQLLASVVLNAPGSYRYQCQRQFTDGYYREAQRYYPAITYWRILLPKLARVTAPVFCG